MKFLSIELKKKNKKKNQPSMNEIFFSLKGKG